MYVKMYMIKFYGFYINVYDDTNFVFSIQYSKRLTAPEFCLLSNINTQTVFCFDISLNDLAVYTNRISTCKYSPL